MPDCGIVKMTLAARTAELASVIASAQATDRSGRALDAEKSVLQCLSMLRALRERGGSLYLAGNGGSAAVASHSATDFVNAGSVRAMTLHESSLLTCMTNDFGYENAFARILSTYARPADVLIAISSSGKSPNIRNAAAGARELGGAVITLSGFAPDNPLRTLGDLNIWLDSRDYGLVELGHQFLLQNVADRMRLEQGAKDVER
jgi:D-sedoheptulose 7-phosphate isomerase